MFLPRCFDWIALSLSCFADREIPKYSRLFPFLMEELENLKKIYEKGYMSKVEYEARRTQIIDKITNTSLTPIAFGPSTLAPVTSALPPNNLPLGNLWL